LERDSQRGIRLEEGVFTLMDKTWRGFEKLAGEIFSSLHETATVKHDDSIYGGLSQTNRQIDVSIRKKIDEEDVLIVVQCKNYTKKPADINTVGEFASVITDIQASRGILICKKGFTKQAKIYAKNLGIEILKLHDAESKDWKQEIKIPVLWHEFEPKFQVNLKIKTPDKFGDIQIEFGKSGFYDIRNSETKKHLDIFDLLKEKWNNGEIDRSIEVISILKMTEPLEILGKDLNGNVIWILISDVEFPYQITLKRKLLGYFEPKHCKGIIDINADNTFTASHLPPIGELPKMPMENWQEVIEPVVHLKGTVLSVSNFRFIEKMFTENIEISEVE
jgi:hypothetical protein